MRGCVFSIFLLALFLGASGLAAAERLETAPSFVDALPLADTADGVRVTAPFLLNPATIVPAGATLRFLYVRPAPSGEKAPLVGDGGREGAYSRRSPEAASEAWTSPQLDAAVRVAHRTVWPNVATFRAAFAAIDGSDLRLVYQKSGEKEPSDAAVEFFRGFLPVERAGEVRVLAVERKSAAEKAGLQPDDRIDRCNGQAVGGSLATFQQMIDAARAEGLAPIRLEVVRKGGLETIEIVLTPPPSLKGSLLDL